MLRITRARVRGATVVAVPANDKAGIGLGPIEESAKQLGTYVDKVLQATGTQKVDVVGHSQGAGILRRLVAEEVDGEPALRARMVSALLIGTAVEVPEGEVVGGTFDEVPLCEASDQLACVVSYATFPADDPPGPDARFGRTDEEGLRVACVNPAAQS